MKKKQSLPWYKLRFKWWLWGLLFLILIFLGLAVKKGVFINNPEQEEVNLEEEKEVYTPSPPVKWIDLGFILSQPPSHLTGSQTQKTTDKQIISAIIENFSPIRRQQKGLEEASIVYEAPVEGGITRFLALYDQPVKEIGPIRSARPYFITWASEYASIFTHVGGSQTALENLKDNFRIYNIDEKEDSKVIYRNSKYLAPHNAYASIQKILKEVRGKYSKKLEVNRFKFKEEGSSKSSIKLISIDFSNDPYKVTYKYNLQSKSYDRFNGGQRHGQISPDNVIVQYVDQEVIDDTGRLRLQTHGTGNALIFTEGEVIEGVWQKDGSINSEDQPIQESFTRFFDKKGNEVSLKKGKTWIEIVPSQKTVNYF